MWSPEPPKKTYLPSGLISIFSLDLTSVWMIYEFLLDMNSLISKHDSANSFSGSFLDSKILASVSGLRANKFLLILDGSDSVRKLGTNSVPSVFLNDSWAKISAIVKGFAFSWVGVFLCESGVSSTIISRASLDRGSMNWLLDLWLSTELVKKLWLLKLNWFTWFFLICFSWWISRMWGLMLSSCGAETWSASLLRRAFFCSAFCFAISLRLGLLRLSIESPN